MHRCLQAASRALLVLPYSDQGFIFSTWQSTEAKAPPHTFWQLLEITRHLSKVPPMFPLYLAAVQATTSCSPKPHLFFYTLRKPSPWEAPLGVLCCRGSRRDVFSWLWTWCCGDWDLDAGSPSLGADPIPSPLKGASAQPLGQNERSSSLGIDQMFLGIFSVGRRSS